MVSRPRRSRNSLIFGGIALWGLLLIGCVGVNRAVLAPPTIPGATFVGDKDCALCHDDQTDHFKNASHAKLALADPKLGTTGCEACHGPGSLHSKAGGGTHNIVNPKESPLACFACHLDKRGEFSLPHSHPVIAGKVSCVDCHDVHGDDLGHGAAKLANINETCASCHTAQKGPFVYEHGGTKEGCVSCHNPHGSINQKMLVARDSNLCLQCHLETPITHGNINANAIGSQSNAHTNRTRQGTCWSAGCHEAVHGSNTNHHLRR